MQLNHEPGPKRRARVNDNQPHPESTGFAEDFVMAVRFYSRLRIGKSAHRTPNLSKIALAAPFASLLIGVLPAAILVVFCVIGLPEYLAAALAVTLAVLVTGAMAEDALADAADGLFGGASRERRLEIMKDSRHGTYGIAALCLLLITRVTALGEMATLNAFAAGALWLAATVVARSGAVWLSAALPPARSFGVSASAGQVRRSVLCLGSFLAIALAFVLAAPAAGLVSFILALLLASVVAVGWTLLCRELIGGQTGDTIGALQALLEIAALVGFMLL
jgi:adenosylcobinamide-GDP ribazoletransferase